jgi:hypothetical protein
MISGRKISVLIAGATITGTMAFAAPANADTLTIQSAAGHVHESQSIWGRVNPFQNHMGYTLPGGEDFVASCKRWGADQKWWYWAKLSYNGIPDITGYIPGDETNLTHSHLDRCS